MQVHGGPPVSAIRSTKILTLRVTLSSTLTIREGSVAEKPSHSSRSRCCSWRYQVRHAGYLFSVVEPHHPPLRRDRLPIPELTNSPGLRAPKALWRRIYTV